MHREVLTRSLIGSYHVILLLQVQNVRLHTKLMHRFSNCTHLIPDSRYKYVGWIFSYVFLDNKSAWKQKKNIRIKHRRPRPKRINTMPNHCSSLSLPEHKVLRVSYYDRSSSVVVRLAIWPNITTMISRWSPTNVVQTVSIGCKGGIGVRKQFSNMKFPNSWKHETTRPRLFIFLSRGPLPKLFKLCLWCQKCPGPRCHKCTSYHIEKILLTTSSSKPLNPV